MGGNYVGSFLIHKSKNVCLTCSEKSKSKFNKYKEINNKSSHWNNKRHFISFCNFFFLFLNTVLPTGIYLQRNSSHTPLRSVKRGATRSMRPAAWFRGPPLPRSAVAINAAVVALAESAIQNVLDVLYYQVYGHKVVCSSWDNHICIFFCW